MVAGGPIRQPPSSRASKAAFVSRERVSAINKAGNVKARPGYRAKPAKAAAMFAAFRRYPK
jgi:hypothetical protein